MRLEKIKLAGFKSFVDQTTITFSSDLVGVVGPNGCGKSNVIDAVRWVLGESSAKHLRGHQMSDVIFNGSTTRKPVGQAFVELVFDNSEGTLSGEFAEYNQLSFKRLIGRDGQSTYFLNGTRCRRKDITQLFLGTGLGPRSYAIIEQGTIARLVEATPAELRAFLEEAAGVSKYKEQRREAENRIGRTRENLERLADVCDEVDKQCQHLKEQADIAITYKKFKAEERALTSELLVLKWQGLEEKNKQQQATIQLLTLDVDRCVGVQRSLEKDIEVERQRHSDCRDELDKKQGSFYQLGTDISKSEQTLKQTQLHSQQVDKELLRYKSIVAKTGENKAGNKQQVLQLTADLDNAKQAVLAQEALKELAEATLLSHEAKKLIRQEKWLEYNEFLAEPRRQIEVEKTNIQQLNKQLLQINQYSERLTTEHQELKQQLEGESLQQQQDEQRQLTLRQREATVLITRLTKEIEDLKKRLNTKKEGLIKQQAEQAQLVGRLESITTLLQRQFGETEQQLKQWLESVSLSEAPLLMDIIQVDAGWEVAVGCVLDKWLQAVCVNDAKQYISKPGLMPDVSLMLFSLKQGDAKETLSETSLARRVHSESTVINILNDVHIAESVEQAKIIIKDLKAHESVITREGTWLHSDGVFFSPPEKNKSTLLLAKEKGLLVNTIESLVSTLIMDAALLKGIEEGLLDKESAMRELSLEDSQWTKQLSLLEAKIHAKEATIKHANERLVKVKKDLMQVESESLIINKSLANANEGLSLAHKTAEEMSQKGKDLQVSADQEGVLFEAAKKDLADAVDQLHQFKVNVEVHNSSLALIQHKTRAEDEQYIEARRQMSDLLQQQKKLVMPAKLQEGELAKSIEKHAALDKELTRDKENLLKVELAIKAIEAKRNIASVSVEKAREKGSLSKISHQDVLVRQQSLLEQLDVLGFNIEGSMAQLPADADEKAWQNKLLILGQKTTQLGAINLTAIDEYSVQLERQKYLSNQEQDLTQSLLILEGAIDKIDKESKRLFQLTFDKVNAGFGRRFPKLFGGGCAYLKLTESGLSDAGISVMAQPPGKRNSSIHLLSGGEKSLVAVALVFAIFDLNPAPFCMLDEVDAPLDEANVGRFCELVKDMSEHVQMILITHNKVTMEIAHQLSGVTMKEPGVSRVVSVDLDVATKMINENINV